VRSPSPGVDDGASLSRPAGFSPVRSTDQVSITVHELATGTSIPGDAESSRSARPILLAHATGFHGLVWAPLARHLDGFRAFAPDLRGHGDSPPPADGDMHWEGFADDVLAVVDAMAASGLDVDGLAAAGHSKGGAALLLAEQRRPGTFGAIYCFEPVVMPPQVRSEMGSSDRVGNNALADGALRRRDRFASRDEAYANYCAKPPFSILDPDALRAYVDHGFADQPDGSVRLKCRPETEAAVYRMGGAHAAFDHLDEVRCPVTIAVGEIEGFGPAAFASLVADAVPDGRLVEFGDLGHFGPLQDPARIAASIVDAVS
jgi:pimeloyl-ACP methyl ester carboxylesterase